jgi:hypothetical protein
MESGRASAKVLAASLPLVIGAVCRAESPQLEEARRHLDAFEVDRALAVLEPLVTDPATPIEEQVAALTLKGRILVGLGCDARAVRTYHELLQRAPGFVLPEAESPKVVACFDLARDTLPPAATPAPALAPTIPAQSPAEEPRESVLGAWWLWTGAAAAVLAVVGGVVWAVAAGGDEPVRGNLGHVDGWPP